MHRYRIVHVCEPYSGPVIETFIGNGASALLDALAAIIRLSGNINTIERANGDSIIKVETEAAWGHYNLVRVSDA